jgi:hypothetical protein
MLRGLESPTPATRKGKGKAVAGISVRLRSWYGMVGRWAVME